MIELKNDLTGGLDLDTSFYKLRKNTYVDALNVTKDSAIQSEDLVITNIPGNRYVPYNKPAGTNVTIGKKEDVLRGRVFEFMWNSNSKHSIIIFDVATRTRTKLIENITDTNNVDVLSFSRYNKIIHCDIIYRDESEGDLLFWTDGVVSPRKLNINHIQDGSYTYIKTPFIELAKQPPLNPVVCVYGSDATRNANSLRKKLIQATYRHVYDDFEKSTFTTYSKIPLPVGYYGSDNDIDSTKNNFITFTVETGDENVTDIEIAVRFNISNDWDDFVLIISLNKEQLVIPNNSTYDYLFYNDGIYPPLEVDEVIQLFDWVPKKAWSQCAPNGNVIALGAITENYDNYPIDSIDVELTVENIKNVPPDTDPPAITYTNFAGPDYLGYLFTVNGAGSVPVGTQYSVSFTVLASSGTFTCTASYTSILGDTPTDVAHALYVSATMNYASGYFIQIDDGSGKFSIGVIHDNPEEAPVSAPTVTVISGAVTPGEVATEKTWLWNANYIFGQGYKDEQGRLMPGVTTKIDPIASDNDYLVTTPSFSLDGSDVETPVITAKINHLPYPGSRSFAWVRRRMTYSNFLMYETCDYQSDSDFIYFCLANIEKYKTDQSQFIYGTAPITSESRIKVIAGVTTGAYDGDIYTEDYEILGLVTKKLTGGTSPADDKQFIKVKKPASGPSPAYKVNMLVMIYTPMSNPTDSSNSVYYEWGEEYETYTGYTIAYTALSGSFSVGETVTGSTSGATGIISGTGTGEIGISDLSGIFVNGEFIVGGTSGASATFTSISGGVLYHRGKDQDQTSFQPATYVWVEGDVYLHQRVMYSDIKAATVPPTPNTLNIMDANWSDFFLSAVNDNGRGLTIEVNARETYFPATIRFSREYQQNTNINQTNRFFFNNFIDLDRSFGDIFKMSVRDRYVRIGQRFKIGVVPIFNQISKDSQSNTILAATDVLLNPVQYYAGDYGVGTSPEAWTDYNFSSYFFDNNRGIWCRLSGDGVTPISILYKINSWAVKHGVLRTGNYKIYGTYDPRSNNCLFAFEATDTDPAYTISFDEENNSFESFLSYYPEMMAAIGSLLITWKNGDLYTHDSDGYNNFYGVQYPSSISTVWNDKAEVKKVFNAISYRSNQIFESPENGDIATSIINPQTGLQQISQLKEVDYEIQENVRYAALLRDANSMTDQRLALCEGDFLLGDWIFTKLICPASKTSSLVFLQSPYIVSELSNRNF